MASHIRVFNGQSYQENLAHSSQLVEGALSSYCVRSNLGSYNPKITLFKGFVSTKITPMFFPMWFLYQNIENVVLTDVPKLMAGASDLALNII